LSQSASAAIAVKSKWLIHYLLVVERYFFIVFGKISPVRLADIPGVRRRKPPVRARAAKVKSLILEEDKLLAALVRDNDLRRRLLTAEGQIIEPLDAWSVVWDFDQTQPCFEVERESLPEWDNLTERMKAHLGAQLALEFGGFSLNANLSPTLESKWLREGRDFRKLIHKRIAKAMVDRGFEELPYFYVIEGRTKSGKSHKIVHIHGYFIARQAILATKFMLVLETAMRNRNLNKVGRDRGVLVKPLYEANGGKYGPGRWVSYILKNVEKYDQRFRGRRIFFSHALTRNVRDFWSLICEEADR
jgi:hypothetical protein